MLTFFKKKLPDLQYLQLHFSILKRKTKEISVKRPKLITFKYQYIFLTIKGYFGLQYIYIMTNNLFKITFNNNNFFFFNKNLIRTYFWLNFIKMNFIVLYNYLCDLSFLYKRFLVVRGVGFKVFYNNHVLQITIGYSYIVHYYIVNDIDIKVMGRKNKKFGVYGLLRNYVNNIVYLIQNIHIPDIYCAQGIFTSRKLRFFYLKPGKKQFQY